MLRLFHFYFFCLFLTLRSLILHWWLSHCHDFLEGSASKFDWTWLSIPLVKDADSIVSNCRWMTTDHAWLSLLLSNEQTGMSSYLWLRSLVFQFSKYADLIWILNACLLHWGTLIHSHSWPVWPMIRNLFDIELVILTASWLDDLQFLAILELAVT